MLIQFSFENYRSFKNPTTLSMSASFGKENQGNTFDSTNGKLLKSVAVFGSNAAGKSNLMKALVSSIMIIRTSASRQVDEAIPYVDKFLFDPDGKEETSFEYDFTSNGKRFIYGFSCTKEEIRSEHLMVYNTQKPSSVFSRKKGTYLFPDAKYKKELLALAERNTPNKLFLATATAWNALSTRDAFLWFSRFIDVYEPSNPIPMFTMFDKDEDGTLKAFTKKLLRESDINISDYTIESREVEKPSVYQNGVALPGRAYLVSAEHVVTGENGEKSFLLPMKEESQGTQNLFFLSPQIKNALDNGFVFCVDELDSSLHPALVLYLVGLFNNEETNPKNAQLIITTHTTELLSMHYMRRDQIYFVDKDNDSGISELYSLDEYSIRTREDIRKAYLNGKFGAIPNII